MFDVEAERGTAVSRTRKLVEQMLFALLCLCLQFTLVASAQQSNPVNDESQPGPTPAVQEDAKASATSHPKKTKAKKSRRGAFVAAPIPTSSAALGAGAT